MSLRVTRSGQAAWVSRPCEAQVSAAMPVSKQAGRPEEEGPPAVSWAEFLDFSVEDTGLGISSEALTRLFQLFTQADSSINEKYGGTGIGLAVSKRLAEAMGGSISVASVPGKGSASARLPSTSRWRDDLRPSYSSALTAHRPPAHAQRRPCALRDIR
ncbi:MAG: ATP-binding protein [Verrucomicrobiae bacterium]